MEKNTINNLTITSCPYRFSFNFCGQKPIGRIINCLFKYISINYSPNSDFHIWVCTQPYESSILFRVISSYLKKNDMFYQDTAHFLPSIYSSCLSIHLSALVPFNCKYKVQNVFFNLLKHMINMSFTCNIPKT